jgi:hypothetical protein
MYYGSEFISKVMDKWAYDRGIELDFSRPPEFISSWGKHVDFIRFYYETCPYKRVTGLIWLGKLTFKALNTLASSGLMVPTPDMGSDPLMETR